MRFFWALRGFEELVRPAGDSVAGNARRELFIKRRSDWRATPDSASSNTSMALFSRVECRFTPTMISLCVEAIW